MKKHTTRTVIIYLVLLASLIYIYPTIGWMLLDEGTRQARLETWKIEDRERQEPSVTRDSWKAIKRWAQCDRAKVVNLGLDLQGGIHMVLGLDMEHANQAELQKMKDAGASDKDIVKELQSRALRTITRRVNDFEAKEPVIQTYGDRQIQIQLPGERDVDRAKSLIMKTAYLTFHLVVMPEGTDKVFRDIEEKFPKQFLPYLRQEAFGAPYEYDTEYNEIIRSVVADAVATPDLIPSDMLLAFSKAPNTWDEKQTYSLYLLEATPVLTGEHLTQASARPNPSSLEGFYHIMFEVDTNGGRIFSQVSGDNTGRAMAIAVDSVVESAPNIQGKFSTNVEITGSFSQEQARDLSIALNSGSMPAPIREEFTGVVGASLGADSIRYGVWSSIMSLILVVVFMQVYYRRAGFVANVGLLYCFILILACMAYFKATLTLPGIAGLILTLGMAVDSNVLIYERIREEVRNGRTFLASLNNGFDMAQVTILDSQITTLIAGVVLLQFGSGPIQGFAVTLCIGIMASIFMSLVVCRGLFDWMAKHNRLGSMHMMSIFKKEPNISYFKIRSYAIGASLFIIAIGMMVFAYREYVGTNGMYGVDFTTGTNMVVTLKTPDSDPIPVGDIREQVTDVGGFKDPIIQEYGEPGTNQFMVRIHDVDDMANAAITADQTVSSRVQKCLLPLTGSEDIAAVAIDRSDTVGPAVGDALKYDAIVALLASFAFIMVYVWVRFEFKFAVGSIVALVHDVVITVGILALTNHEISLNVVAALLTIIGYSLNDTIVIFDRVRENLKLLRSRDMSLPAIMDLSVNQTMSRTLLTALTSFIVVLVMYLMGGDVINDFAFTMLIGTVVGVYSTVFIASPVAYYIQVWENRRKGIRTEEAPSPRRRKMVTAAQPELALADGPQADAEYTGEGDDATPDSGDADAAKKRIARRKKKVFGRRGGKK